MKTTVLCRYRPHGCTCNLNIRIKQDVSSCIWFSRSFVLSFHFLSLSHIWIANENKSFASNFFFKWKPAQIILSLLRTYKTKKEEKESSKKRLSILFYILCVHVRRQYFLTLLQLAQFLYAKSKPIWLTGIDAGLLTTTISSSIWRMRIFSEDTGTSCLHEKNQHM